MSDDGGAVILRGPRQKPAEPAPIAIWEAEFEGRDAVAGFKVERPSDVLPKLAFSRFPLRLSLVARGSLQKGFRATWESEEGDVDTSRGQAVVGDRWFLLDAEMIERVSKAIATRGIAVPGAVSLGQLIWLRAGADLELPFVDHTEDAGQLTDLPPLPALGLREGTVLFPYQATGISFMARVAREDLGCILADEMGLGKTLQVIGLLAQEQQAHRTPNLVVCPATILENWRRELAQFAPQLQTFIHAGPGRPGRSRALCPFDVVLTTFETLVRDEPMLTEVQWNIVVVDEAQYLKNPDAQRTMAAKRLKRRLTIAATGTPVENRLTDLWSISDLVLPGLLGSRSQFESEFDDTHQDADRLAPIVAPLMLRRRVAEVAKDLPPRIDIPQPVSMTRQLALQYEALRAAIQEEFGSSATLVSIGKLRQLCAHPRLVGIDWADLAAGMPKYQRLVEILEELFSAGEKALVFSSFTGMADIMIADLASRFPNAWRAIINGSVPISKRQKIVDEFTAHPGFGILVLNPKAAGVGLNITAANHVIHYTPEWNPAVEDQASARAYRRKQTRPVTIHHLFFANSVEEVMVDRLNLKRGLADGAAVGNQGTTDAADIARALAASPLSNEVLD